MSKLIGTKPHQVPSNADLGTLAYADADRVTIGQLTTVHHDSVQGHFRRIGGQWSTLVIEAGTDTGNSRIAFNDPDAAGTSQNTADGMLDFEHSNNSFRFHIGANNTPKMVINETGDLDTGANISIDAKGSGNTASLKFINDNERSRISSNYGASGGGELSFWTDTTGGSLLKRLTIYPDGYLAAQSASQVRLVLGSTGQYNNNTSNWIRGTGNELGFNTGGGGYHWEITGAQKMGLSSTGVLDVVGKVFAGDGFNNNDVREYAQAISGIINSSSYTFDVPIQATGSGYTVYYECMYNHFGNTTYGAWRSGMFSFRSLSNSTSYDDVIINHGNTNAGSWSVTMIDAGTSSPKMRFTKSAGTYPGSGAGHIFVRGGLVE